MNLNLNLYEYIYRFKWLFIDSAQLQSVQTVHGSFTNTNLKATGLLNGKRHFLSVYRFTFRFVYLPCNINLCFTAFAISINGVSLYSNTVKHLCNKLNILMKFAPLGVYIKFARRTPGAPVSFHVGFSAVLFIPEFMRSLYT